MNVADTLRGLLRRWYIVVPGFLLAIAAAAGAYIVVSPGYERTATQLLMPGAGTVPPGATNPYLYLGGLTQAADIVVRVMQSDEVAGVVAAEHPGVQLEVERDPNVSGPAIQITVTASSDEAAARALSAMVGQTGEVLERLQVDQGVTADDQMTVSTLTEDQESTLQQRSRLVMSAGVGFAVVVLTVLVASLVDGLIRRVRRSGRKGTRLAAGQRRAEDAEEENENTEVGREVEDVPEPDVDLDSESASPPGDDLSAGDEGLPADGGESEVGRSVDPEHPALEEASSPGRKRKAR